MSSAVKRFFPAMFLGIGRRARRGQKKTASFNGGGFSNINPGVVLLSHTVTHAVPLALKGLTSVFGMGTGVTLSLSRPGKSRS